MWLSCSIFEVPITYVMTSQPLHIASDASRGPPLLGMDAITIITLWQRLSMRAHWRRRAIGVSRLCRIAEGCGSLTCRPLHRDALDESMMHLMQQSMTVCTPS